MKNKKNNIRSNKNWCGALLVIAMLWGACNAIPILVGMGMAGYTHDWYNPCKEPLTRIEYVFPGYRIGCWLGSVP